MPMAEQQKNQQNAVFYQRSAIFPSSEWPTVALPKASLPRIRLVFRGFLLKKVGFVLSQVSQNMFLVSLN